MEVNLGASVGLLVAIGLAVVAVIAIVAFVLIRRSSTAQVAGSGANTPATEAPRPASPAPAPTAPAPPERLERLLVEVDGMILGAVPPYGMVEFDGTHAHFVAQTRIVAAAGDGVLGGDASSTMQSLGSMEMGQFTCDLELDGATIEMEPDGEGVRVVSGGRSARFAAVAGDHARVASALRKAAGQQA